MHTEVSVMTCYKVRHHIVKSVVGLNLSVTKVRIGLYRNSVFIYIKRLMVVCKCLSLKRESGKDNPSVSMASFFELQLVGVK